MTDGTQDSEGDLSRMLKADSKDRYGAIIAQPRRKDTSSFPSLRTSSNRMRRFFMTSS